MNPSARKTAVVAAALFVIGGLIGGSVYHFFWADRCYRAGYNKAILNMKHQFEKVMKENTMFYSEELNAVFVSKGGDTFEVVVPGAGGRDTKND